MFFDLLLAGILGIGILLILHYLGNLGTVRNQLYQPRVTARRHFYIKNLEKREYRIRLVKELVNKFKDFRQSTSQFALIFLLRSEESRNWIFTIRSGHYLGEKHPNPYPHFHFYRNFILARPTPTSHAEELILDNLEFYTTDVLSRKDVILLYTWLEPCQLCVFRIVQALSAYTSSHLIMIMYTVKLRTNLQPLLNAGMEVYRVPYYASLPHPSLIF